MGESRIKFVLMSAICALLSTTGANTLGVEQNRQFEDAVRAREQEVSALAAEIDGYKRKSREIDRARALFTDGLSKDGAQFSPCHLTGRTLPGAWVVSNCGQITRANAKGDFDLLLPVQGIYCVKAMADGYSECIRPWLEVPTKEPIKLHLKCLPEPRRRVVHGNIGHPAQLKITDSGLPIRGFDLAGTPVGSYNAAKGVWHEKNPFFWTTGEYCFTATGEVKIVESLNFPELRTRGWYKGDFHAHIVHYENFYRANLQQMAFVCRAENYDWIYLSGGHSNDDYPVDFVKLSEYLSDKKFFMRVNNEFPKNNYGHFGNINVLPIGKRDVPRGWNEDNVTALEMCDCLVVKKGGVSIPVHPLYRGSVKKVDVSSGRKSYGMINKELMLWLLCRPDMIPVVDFFYSSDKRGEEFWYRLLNKGYKIACCATSDAAFDVGRSPGVSHATYVKLGGLGGPEIVEAFRDGRTMVSYFGAAVIMNIDRHISGDVVRSGNKKMRLRVDAFGDPEARMTLRVVRNGKVIMERSEVVPKDGKFSMEKTITESGNAWYVATLKDEGSDRIRAAASPIYFRTDDFTPPETFALPNPLPDKIKSRLLYLSPDELDTDEWYEELKEMLKKEGRE